VGQAVHQGTRVGIDAGPSTQSNYAVLDGAAGDEQWHPAGPGSPGSAAARRWPRPTATSFRPALRRCGVCRCSRRLTAGANPSVRDPLGVRAGAAWAASDTRSAVDAAARRTTSSAAAAAAATRTAEPSDYTAGTTGAAIAAVAAVTGVGTVGSETALASGTARASGTALTTSSAFTSDAAGTRGAAIASRATDESSGRARAAPATGSAYPTDAAGAAGASGAARTCFAARAAHTARATDAAGQSIDVDEHTAGPSEPSGTPNTASPTVTVGASRTGVATVAAFSAGLGVGAVDALPGHGVGASAAAREPWAADAAPTGGGLGRAGMKTGLLLIGIVMAMSGPEHCSSCRV